MTQTDTSIRQLAEEIADDLLTCGGDGEKADRLVLTVDAPPKRSLGGWGRTALIHRIESHLKSRSDV